MKRLLSVFRRRVNFEAVVGRSKIAVLSRVDAAALSGMEYQTVMKVFMAEIIVIRQKLLLSFFAGFAGFGCFLACKDGTRLLFREISDALIAVSQ